MALGPVRRLSEALRPSEELREAPVYQPEAQARPNPTGQAFLRYRTFPAAAFSGPQAYLKEVRSIREAEKRTLTSNSLRIQCQRAEELTLPCFLCCTLRQSGSIQIESNKSGITSPTWSSTQQHRVNRLGVLPPS